METTSTTTTLTTETTAKAARSFAEQTPGEQLFTLAIFGLGTAVSIAFAYYLFTDPARLTEAWAWTRSLPLWVQGVMWLLLLPWMIALVIWVMPWALPIRMVLVVGVLLAATWLLFPWK
jgi:hypothetical protein